LTEKRMNMPETAELRMKALERAFRNWEFRLISVEHEQIAMDVRLTALEKRIENGRDR
jgi:hypothetical protein